MVQEANHQPDCIYHRELRQHLEIRLSLRQVCMSPQEQHLLAANQVIVPQDYMFPHEQQVLQRHQREAPMVYTPRLVRHLRVEMVLNRRQNFCRIEEVLVHRQMVAKVLRNFLRLSEPQVQAELVHQIIQLSITT
jgi:hypothetical protein